MKHSAADIERRRDKQTFPCSHCGMPQRLSWWQRLIARVSIYTEVQCSHCGHWMLIDNGVE